MKRVHDNGNETQVDIKIMIPGTNGSLTILSETRRRNIQETTWVLHKEADKIFIIAHDSNTKIMIIHDSYPKE